MSVRQLNVCVYLANFGWQRISKIEQKFYGSGSNKYIKPYIHKATHIYVDVLVKVRPIGLLMYQLWGIKEFGVIV